MINPKSFLNALKKSNVNFITGVPDSLLKDICAYISENLSSRQHIIATNEGSAIGLAIGNYLATNQVPLVYMQNSGIGNIINPITSLADPKVYGIPILLMIGWRGEIDNNGIQMSDEPQHKKQGEITLKQLDILGIPYKIIDSEEQEIEKIISSCVNSAKRRNGPVALVVRKKTFKTYIFKAKNNAEKFKPLYKREDVIREIIKSVPDSSPIISTTGVSSRELFEIRSAYEQSHKSDFLTVGGMGHANQIATGIALAKKDIKVFCIDGDGAILMHMGALAINGEQENLVHILINNGAHDSVGGQPTKGAKLEFSRIAKELGYKFTYRTKYIESIKTIIEKSLKLKGSIFIEILCIPGFREDLGRPTKSTYDNKNNFMNFLSS
tara:strand:- start:1237 stop:2382 length:1146 start_codon:yes stop_codon:yes gene_type:complete